MPRTIFMVLYTLWVPTDAYLPPHPHTQYTGTHTHIHMHTNTCIHTCAHTGAFVAGIYVTLGWSMSSLAAFGWGIGLSLASIALTTFISCVPIYSFLWGNTAVLQCQPLAMRTCTHTAQAK